MHKKVKGSLCQEVFLADKPSTGSDRLAPSWSRDVHQGEAHDESTVTERDPSCIAKQIEGGRQQGPWETAQHGQQSGCLLGICYSEGDNFGERCAVWMSAYWVHWLVLQIWAPCLAMWVAAGVLRVCDIHTVPPGWTQGTQSVAKAFLMHPSPPHWARLGSLGLHPGVSLFFASICWELLVPGTGLGTWFYSSVFPSLLWSWGSWFFFF